MENAYRLSTWDYACMSALVCTASAIGIYHIFAAKKGKTNKEFLVTSPDLGVTPLIMSATATFYSSIGILGYPKETYMNGTSFLIIALPTILCIPLGTHLFLPVFFELQIGTIFEYLEMRFSRFIRMCASTLVTINLMLYTAIVVYAPALALNQVTGLPLWTSVASIATICIIYTSMGGIKAVVWADASQMVIMFGVLLLILIKGISDVGGLQKIWEINKAGYRTDTFIFSSSPYSSYSFWTLAIGGTVYSTAVMATNQMLMQRYLSNRKLRDARISMIGSSLGVTFMAAFLSIFGLVIYAKYGDCDPLVQGQVTSRDQMMALFAVETLSFQDGVPGFFVAAILCATLSTMSSSLNSMAAISMEDFIKPLRPNLSDKTAIILSKFLGIIYGLISIGLVAAAENMGGLIKAVFSVNGILGAPVFALFVVGMLFPFVNTLGATLGFISGVLLPGWACIGNLVTSPLLNSAPIGIEGCNVTTSNNGLAADLTNDSSVDSWTITSLGATEAKQINDSFNFYALSSMWYSSWAVLIGCCIAVIVSKLTGSTGSHTTNPKLLFPFVRRLPNKLSEKYSTFLGFRAEASTAALQGSLSAKEQDLGISGNELCNLPKGKA